MKHPLVQLRTILSTIILGIGLVNCSPSVDPADPNNIATRVAQGVRGTTTALTTPIASVSSPQAVASNTAATTRPQLSAAPSIVTAATTQLPSQLAADIGCLPSLSPNELSGPWEVALRHFQTIAPASYRNARLRPLGRESDTARAEICVEIQTSPGSVWEEQYAIIQLTASGGTWRVSQFPPLQPVQATISATRTAQTAQRSGDQARPIGSPIPRSPQPTMNTAVAIPDPRALGPNLVMNPSFETGDPVFPSYWYAWDTGYIQGGRTGGAYEFGLGHTGDRAVSLTIPNSLPQDAATVWSGTLQEPLRTGQYLVTIWFMATGDVDNRYSGIGVLLGEGLSVSDPRDSSVSINRLGEWFRWSTITSVEHGAEARISIALRSFPRPSPGQRPTRVYIDDVEVRAVTTGRASLGVPTIVVVGVAR